MDRGVNRRPILFIKLSSKELARHHYRQFISLRGREHSREIWLMCYEDRLSPTRSYHIQHFRGISSGYVEITPKIKRGISIGWENYSIPAASSITI